MSEVYKAKWILPANEQVLEDKAIVVKDGQIQDIIDGDKIAEYFGDQEYEFYDYGNAILTPGFINMHTHLQYTDIFSHKPTNKNALIKRFILNLRKLFLVGYIPPEKFMNWMINLFKEYKCWGRKDKVKSFKKGLEMSIISGTTTLSQVSAEKEFFDILNNIPIKTYIFIELFSDSERSSKRAFRKLKKQVDKLLSRKKENTFLGIAPHSLYSVHRRLWKVIAKFARKYHALLQTNLGECQDELDWLKSGHSDVDLFHKFIGFQNMTPDKKGLTPVEYLQEFDAMRDNFIAVHVNQLYDEELNTLSKLGASVVHCPRSNQYHHKKTANIFNLMKYFPGKVAFGTDSLISNKDLSILNEAKYVRNTKKGIDDLKYLDMMTINAAKILKLDDKVGSLEKGKDADFLVFLLEEGESHKNLFDKEYPDYVFSAGEVIAKNKNLLLKLN
jgi:5-methylthioadenosine/S-adenosylhomocysteine deaminase